ncbi:penicillin acylase family protein [Corallococcus sicarius]|uniref:Uncharacterized protein n=1 Tax=Corallococcus sicarius TaxID=2316726 RepID=A0A3A8NIV3_9BACT|nr:penicillin acylase family protein [Corallococcus sicarius]RKH44297.1 hypothetical protein D7X12_10985 [Corallococcus sicarius]
MRNSQADGYRALGAGSGYTQAQDAVCILADQFLKVRGERARYFGRGPQDAYVEKELQELVKGYAAGYNQYLQDTPADQRPAPCKGANWVKPISAFDLLAYHLDLSLFDTLIPLLGYVANAQPPQVSAGGRGPQDDGPGVHHRRAPG